MRAFFYISYHLYNHYVVISRTQLTQMPTLREIEKDSFLQANTVPHQVLCWARLDFSLRWSPLVLACVTLCSEQPKALCLVALAMCTSALRISIRSLDYASQDVSCGPSGLSLCLSSYTKCVWICFKGAIAVVMPSTGRRNNVESQAGLRSKCLR